MTLEYERPDIETTITSARSWAELDAAMEQVILLNRGFRNPAIHGRKLFVGWFDKLAPGIANRLGLIDVPQPQKSNERIVVLATILRHTGGHSQVVKDIMHAFPGQVTGIYTDSYRELPEELGEMPQLTTVFQERAWLYPRRRRLLERCVEVYMMLKAIQPTRILLFGHGMDIVPILAAWPFREVTEFVHHFDHAPAVGATLPFSSHVDLTYRCHLACREAGLNPVYAGMTSPTLATGPRPQRDAGKGLVIATCGSSNKYRGAGAFSWASYFTAALKAEPYSRIVHIGTVTEDVMSAIAAGLKKERIDPSRYVVTGFVPSLHAELIAQGADVYLSSYPEAGGKANLEALAAQIPVIVPVDLDAPSLSRFDIPMPGWIEINRPYQIANALKKARALGEDLQSTEYVAALRRELNRFENYIHLRTDPSPADHS